MRNNKMPLIIHLMGAARGLVVGAIVRTFKFRAVNPDVRAKAGASTTPTDGVLVDLELR